MKRLLLLLLLAAPGWALPAPAWADVKVFACEPEWAALAREVGGDRVTAFSATSDRQNPHYIRARPSLIARIRRADLVICSGGGLEVGWLPILMRRGAPARVQPGQIGYMMAADHVTVLEKPAVVDRSLGDVHPEGNPHVHLDARNIITLAQEVAKRLSQIDAANATTYYQRTADFVRTWETAMADWQARAKPLNGMPVVTHHKTWSYLLDWLGLKEVASLEVRPGIPPTPAHLSSLLASMRTQPAAAILRTPFDPPDAAAWLSEKTGITVLVPPYTVTKDAGPGALRAMFEKTVAQLAAAHSASNARQ
ncbi:MAG: zinc ABC transporter substrate-binding protein [Alphaproteobacteria bacterium]|jgi:zinc/manganese transport system substrate-binding protein|nr:zinc ABC transporter substrate-binding protein [Alphaproteobacteria bacterium]